MIRAANLTKRYGDTLAVYDMSFEITAGECMGLLGLNGAGKTTLLRMMSCLLSPTSGKMTVDGIDVTQSPDQVLPSIGFLPEESPLYGEMTVRGFLEFMALLRRVPSNQLDSRVADAVRKCTLGNVLDQRIETLSYGFKKRVGIAQAIVHGPPLVILDEPIAGLDPAQIVGIRELVLGLRGEHTVVVSSHILTEISQICDRILVVHGGRIVASGSEEKLSERLGETFSLVVKVSGDQDLAVSVVEGLLGARSCRSADQEGDTVTLEVNATSDMRAELSRSLVEAGLDLLELYRKRDKLESVFLDVTGRKGGQA